MDGIQLCSNQMLCSNTEGGFDCHCPTGTTLVDGLCNDSKFVVPSLCFKRPYADLYPL